MNKKKVLVISIVGILLISVVMYLIGKSVATIDSTILREQEVENLTFAGANLTYENKISTFTVTVTNTLDKEYSLNYIEIKFISEDDEVDTLIGYVGDTIEGNGTKVITASIDKDITNSKDIEYVINKEER